MRFSEVFLESFGYVLPDRVLTSDAIETKLAPLYEKIQCPKGRLEQLTGIKERRIWPTGTLPSSIASQAGKKALKNSQLDPKEIDLVIHTGVCRDALEPSTAHLVHHNLNLSSHCLAFDLSNACVGFLNAIVMAANMIELGQIKTALIVTGENAGPLYETTIPNLLESTDPSTFKNSLASLTLGSAGLAYVLTHRSITKTKHQILGGIGHTDSSGHDLCIGNGDIHQLHMLTNTTELMKKGLVLIQKSWELFKRHLDWSNETPNHILTHQISKAHNQKCFELLNIPNEKGYSILEYLGNTGSAAAPLSLAKAAEENKFKEQEKLALLGIGSGITTMMLGIQW